MLEYIAKFLTFFIPMKNFRKKSRKKLLQFLQRLQIIFYSITRANKFDMIVSLGGACQTSYQLRKNKLQIKSYPFDWLYSKDTDLVANLIKNNFKDLLNKDFIKIISKESNGDLHVFNTKYKIGIIHDFKGSSIEKDYDEIYEKYNRRIERFNKKLNLSDKILLVYLTKEANNKDIQKLYSTFEKKYITKNFYMYWICPWECEDFLKEEISPKIYKISMNNIDISKKEEEQWKGNNKNFSKLFKDIGLTLKGILI